MSKKRLGYLEQRLFFVKENKYLIFFLDITMPFNYRFNCNIDIESNRSNYNCETIVKRSFLFKFKEG